MKQEMRQGFSKYHGSLTWNISLKQRALVKQTRHNNNPSTGSLSEYLVRSSLNNGLLQI